jgi:xyloglucan-specific endo-beta-1,4-glucanase
MVAGSSWQLYVGNNGGMVVYSFVATSSMNSFNADARAFFSYLEDNEEFPADSQNLIGKTHALFCVFSFPNDSD